MKQKRFTETQIMQILKQAEGGVPVAELCREHGMSSASFYKWRSKYGGLGVRMYDFADEGDGTGKPTPEEDVCGDEPSE
jgi:hypothetical protein